MKTLIVLLSVAWALSLIGPAGAACNTFKVDLSGDEEVPPVKTKVTGNAVFTAKKNNSEIRFKLVVRDNGQDVGLLGKAGAHIHCAPEGQNGPVVAFLAGELAGGLTGLVVLRGTLTDGNIVDSACGDTIKKLVNAMCNGDAYVNVHSISHPSGEIRGQI